MRPSEKYNVNTTEVYQGTEFKWTDTIPNMYPRRSNDPDDLDLSITYCEYPSFFNSLAISIPQGQFAGSYDSRYPYRGANPLNTGSSNDTYLYGWKRENGPHHDKIYCGFVLANVTNAHYYFGCSNTNGNPTNSSANNLRLLLDFPVKKMLFRVKFNAVLKSTVDNAVINPSKIASSNVSDILRTTEISLKELNDHPDKYYVTGINIAAAPWVYGDTAPDNRRWNGKTIGIARIYRGSDGTECVMGIDTRETLSNNTFYGTIQFSCTERTNPRQGSGGSNYGIFWNLESAKWYHMFPNNFQIDPVDTFNSIYNDSESKFHELYGYTSSSKDIAYKFDNYDYGDIVQVGAWEARTNYNSQSDVFKVNSIDYHYKLAMHGRSALSYVAGFGLYFLDEWDTNPNNLDFDLDHMHNPHIYLGEMLSNGKTTGRWIVGEAIERYNGPNKDGTINNPKYGPDADSNNGANINYKGISDIWVYNLRNAVTTDADGNLTTMDITWTPTRYADNNSGGLWMNTDILAAMSDDVSDLERINMLKKIYTSNTKLYDHLRYMMRTAQSKRQYDIYKIVFDSFMQTEANRDFYKLVDTASGNPVYTDGMDNSATYHIVSYTTHVKDSEGFPKYDLLNLTDNTKSRYDFTHNSDYSFCRYVNMTTLDVVECVYNEKKYASEGVKEYYVTPDYTDEFPRGYMYPNNVYENNQKVFVLAENTFAVLQNTDNKKIVIPVVLAEDGTIASYVEGTTEIINGTVTVDMVDEERVHVLIEYDGEDPIELTIKPEWKVASDYYEYLQCRNIDLYNHLIDLKYKYDNVLDPASNTYKPSDEKRQRIEALCEMVAMALEKYFDKKEWKYLFNIIPTANMQNIQSYIMKMVIFFKSWKTQMLDTSVTYQIDDKYENQVRILDDIFVSSDFGDLMDKIRPKDIPVITSQVNYKENVEPGEKVDIKQTPFYGDVTSDANGNLFP